MSTAGITSTGSQILLLPRASDSLPRKKRLVLGSGASTLRLCSSPEANPPPVEGQASSACHYALPLPPAASCRTLSLSKGEPRCHSTALLTPAAVQEFLEEARARLAALLRVEQGGHQSVDGDCAGEGQAVVRLPDHDGAVLGVRVVAVDKVEVSPVRDAVEGGVGPSLVDLVPAHVGYFQTLRQAAHPARDDAQALVLAALFADAEQRLEAHTDAEEGTAGVDVLTNRLHQVTLAQVAHGVGGSALARHDQDVGRGHILRPAADQRLEAGAGHRPLHAAQVVRAVVDADDVHGLHSNIPASFVSRNGPG